MKVYLAAQYQRRGELQMYAEKLGTLGIEVTSRWLNGDHEGLPWEKCAVDDVEDVTAADTIISFTNSDYRYSRGGRHVEFGMGVITKARLILVGRAENVFHELPQVEQYKTWNLCFKQLEKELEAKK